MSSPIDSLKLDLGLAIGFGAGLCYFFVGFRTYREYRVLMDTPEIPIRSVAMGLVEIHGKATGVVPMPSPVTHTPCYFYQVDIDQWVPDKSGGSWSRVATDADGKRFYVADSTGKVLVDAHQAEYDLMQTAQVETERSSGSGFARILSGIDDAPSIGRPSDLHVNLHAYACSKVSGDKSGR